MTYDQAVQVLKEAMRKRITARVYPLKWQEDCFGIELQSPEGFVRRESFTPALDALDVFPVPR